MNRAEEIRKLHEEVTQSSKLTIEKAIKVGGLLQAQKGDLDHGEWGPWLKANLKGFSRATITNYMKLYSERDKLLNVRNLAEAYAVLYGKEEKPNGKPKDKKNKKDKKDKTDKDDNADPPPAVFEFLLSGPLKFEVEFEELLIDLQFNVFNTEDEFDTVLKALWFAKQHRELVDAKEALINA